MYHEVGRSPEERTTLNSWHYTMKLFMSESTGLWAQWSNVGAPKMQRRENAKIPKGRSQFLEGSYPHPGRAGSCRSPASHPCTRPSEQGPGIPTPPERILWPHPWRSTVPEMKTHFNKGPWGESLFSHKMRRGERGKDQFSWSMYSDRSMLMYLEQIMGLEF